MKLTNKNIIRILGGFSFALFATTVTVMLHDTLDLNSKLSQDDIQAVAASHPTLYDKNGKPVQLSEQEYESALISGVYRLDPGATVPMISPKGEVAVVSAAYLELASLKGWRVESTEHELERVIEFKQQDSMWLADSSTMFFHIVLVQFSAILLLAMCGWYKMEGLSRGSLIVGVNREA